MTRILILGAAMLISSLTGLAASGQFKEKVERNISLLNAIAGCAEGFDAAIEGSALLYGSYRADPERALITRATTGAMAIAWKTPPVPKVSPDDAVTFVVMAGIYAQQPSGFTFRMSINDVPRFSFVTSPSETWAVDGTDGGRLSFIGAARDKHGDHFGCLRITVPGAWVTPGEQARIRIVGDKAGHSAWVMVFEVRDVIAYQRDLVKNECYCDVTVRTSGADHSIEVHGPSSWHGQPVSLSLGQSSPESHRFEVLEGSSHAEFTVSAEEFTAPLIVRVNGDLLFRLDTLFRTVHTTLVHPLKLVTLSATARDAAGWRLSYQSTYHPGLGTSLQDLSTVSSGRGTQHLIISTHQDIAWMDSPENCIRDRDEKIITPLLDIMQHDPAYRFDLEDVLCLREYLERHPERETEISLLMREGRLGIGASFNQPYEDLCSGEMLVRQFYAGRRWIRSRFPGCDTRTYWNPDVPGRTLQMPQVMHRAGVEYLVMSRFEKGLYSLFSPDGSRILAYSPGHYGDFKARMEGAGFEQAAGYVASTATGWARSTRSVSLDIPLLSMSDMSGPDRYDAFLAKWADLRSLLTADGSITPLSLPPVRHSNIERYLDAVSQANAELPGIHGDRPNIWLYIHGPTHHHAISAKRDADFLLPAAEIFSTVDALLASSFASYPQAELTAAWESQLYPDHGWGGKNGDITDSTFRAKYEEAREVSSRLLSRAVNAISSRVKTKSGRGTPLLVFNPLSWQRSGPVKVTANLDAGKAKEGLALYDGSGKAIPLHTDITQRHPDGSIRKAELVFVADGVPSVGYATYYLRPARTAHAAQTQSQSETLLENRFYRVVLGAGGARQVFDKELNKDLLDTARFSGGELFTMQSIGEDAGEWDEPQQPTMEGFDKLSNHPAPWQRVESGPVRDIAEARYTLAHTTVVQRIVLYHAVKRIDFEVSLLGWDGTRYREFRLAFPVRAERGQVAYEVPFGVVEVGRSEMKGSAGERYKQSMSRVRPRGIQNWIGVSGDGLAVTLSSSVAVWDYQDPTDLTTERLLLQPVLLASRRSCHGAGPWYLQQGDHHYRFSFTSHAPGWQNGHRQGVEANAPFVAVVGPSQQSRPRLTESMSFVSLDAENVVLSTMKKCEDDGTVIVRLYDDVGRSSRCSLDFFAPVLKAEETSLLEYGGEALPSDKKRVTVQIGNNAIHTLKILPRPIAP